MGQWDTTALLFLDFKFRPNPPPVENHFPTGGEA